MAKKSTHTQLRKHFGSLQEPFTGLDPNDINKLKVDSIKQSSIAFALVYNLVRQVMVEAADRQGVPVARICFVNALRWLKEAALHEPLSKLVVNPDRPDRYEPRVRKRRPKKYKLMKEPRTILKQRLAGQ